MGWLTGAVAVDPETEEVIVARKSLISSLQGFTAGDRDHSLTFLTVCQLVKMCRGGMDTTQHIVYIVNTVYIEIITYKDVIPFISFSLQIQNLSFINNEAHTTLFLFSSQQRQ